MDLQSIASLNKPDIYIPSFPITLKQWQNMELDRRKAPFNRGDIVVPKFIPIDAERGGKRLCEITTIDKLVVKSIIHRGAKFFVIFDGSADIYDTCFFRKV